jgi:hypothetical protein
MRTLLRIIAMVALTFLMLSLTECNSQRSEAGIRTVIESKIEFEVQVENDLHKT